LFLISKQKTSGIKRTAFFNAGNKPIPTYVVGSFATKGKIGFLSHAFFAQRAKIRSEAGVLGAFNQLLFN
jgi:hypothetical protein